MQARLIISIIGFLCAFCTAGNTLAASLDSGAISQELEAAMDKALADSGAPGGIVGVWKGDFTWIKAKGLANVSAETPMAPSYIWRIGSVSKTFVGTAVLRLCEKGLMGLDDPLSKYRPDFPKADQITIRQLLQHSSGIFSWDEDEKVREGILTHPEEKWDAERLITLAAGKPFYFESGGGYHYSNVGYLLLTPIIEQVTGKSMPQVIRDEIIKPLGLDHTFMPEGPRYKEEVIRGYMIREGKLVDTTGMRFADLINYDLAHTAGGMVSTLEDQKVWVQALTSGKLLTDAMHREQFKTIPSAPGSSAGYGLGVTEKDGWIGHSGGVTGAACNVYTYSAADLTIVSFFNKLNPIDEKQNMEELQAYTNLLIEVAETVSPGSFLNK